MSSKEATRDDLSPQVPVVECVVDETRVSEPGHSSPQVSFFHLFCKTVVCCPEPTYPRDGFLFLGQCLQVTLLYSLATTSEEMAFLGDYR